VLDCLVKTLTPVRVWFLEDAMRDKIFGLQSPGWAHRYANYIEDCCGWRSSAYFGCIMIGWNKTPCHIHSSTESLVSTHGVMLVEPVGGGKSFEWRVRSALWRSEPSPAHGFWLISVFWFLLGNLLFRLENVGCIHSEMQHPFLE
jgi:hypothetical protein